MKIQNMFDTCISPLNSEQHPRGIVNIVTGEVAPDAVNVDRALEIGSAQLVTFKASLPEGFYAPLSLGVSFSHSLDQCRS